MISHTPSSRPAGVSKFLLVFGMLAATLGYVATLAHFAVVDATPTADAAAEVLHLPAERTRLANLTLDAMVDQLVGTQATKDLATFGIDVRRDLEPVALTLVESPEFAKAYSRAVVDMHDYVFVEHTRPPELDLAPLVLRAQRDAAAINPAYGTVLPSVSAFRVALPGDALPDLTVAGRELALPRTIGLAAIGLLIVALGIAVAADRARALRGVARWLLATAGIQLLLCLAARPAAERATGDIGAFVRAAVDAVVRTLVIPAAAPLALGFASLLLMALVRRSGEFELADGGRAAFLTDEDGRATEWRFDSLMEPEVLRTAPGKATFKR